MAISLTDREAAWVAYRKIRSIFAYHANYLIDNKCGIIVDAEGNRANRIDENQACVDRVARVARSALGSNPSVSAGARPPVFDRPPKIPIL